MQQQLQLGCSHKNPESLDVAAAIMVVNYSLKPWTALGGN